MHAIISGMKLDSVGEIWGWLFAFAAVIVPLWWYRRRKAIVHRLKIKKLHITKGRIACAVVLLPVLYVLNVGPLIYCSQHFGLRIQWIFTAYHPIFYLLKGSPLRAPYIGYMNWWAKLPPHETHRIWFS
jgi:hypothetical protein